MTGQEITLRDVVESSVAEFQDPIVRENVALAVPEGVSPDKLLRAAATAVLENAELAKPTLRESLIRATLKTAQDGLLPDGREAAFVIFGGKVVYMPMILGLRKIAAEFGWSIFTACVYENDGFDPDLEQQKANHRPTRIGQPRGEMIGVYAAFQHRDGRRMLEVMDMETVEKIRNVSRAKDSGPWKQWYEEMAQIRPARRGFKKLPLDPKDRERIDRVLAATDLDTGERVDLLYGSKESPDRTGDRTPTTEASVPPSPLAASDQEGTPPASTTAEAGAPGPETIDGEAAEVEFDGEEPPPISDEPPTDEPTFASGRYNGKTIGEVYESGKDGLSYLRWAVSSWKTDPLRSALDRFAETHPDVKS